MACQSVITFFRDEKKPLGFSNDKCIEDKSVSHPSLVSRTCLATHFITDTDRRKLVGESILESVGLHQFGSRAIFKSIKA